MRVRPRNLFIYNLKFLKGNAVLFGSEYIKCIKVKAGAHIALISKASSKR
jgi:hypothetical protein